MAGDGVGATLVLTAEEVRRLLRMREVIETLEEAFVAYAESGVEMPPKAYLKVDGGDFRAMPACMGGAAGIKWVNCHPRNPDRGLPTVMAVFVYNDAATGYPLAVMDGTEITAFRTAATAALASKHLSQRSPRTLGLVGAGRQAYSQLVAHSAIFDLELIRVYDIRAEAARRLAESFPEMRVEACSLEQAVASDIVCTLTPAREPFVKRGWVKDGTHINAVGADAAGKQELDPAILEDAAIVVDDLRQASAAGEINVALSTGRLKVEDVYATLAEVIGGRKDVKKAGKAITVFDSTGIAIEDLATARLVYEGACREGLGVAVELLPQA